MASLDCIPPFDEIDMFRNNWEPLGAHDSLNEESMQEFLSCVEKAADFTSQRTPPLTGCCEPTPLNPNSVVVVDRLPLAQTCTRNDENFFKSLRMLLAESAQAMPSTISSLPALPTASTMDIPNPMLPLPTTQPLPAFSASSTNWGQIPAGVSTSDDGSASSSADSSIRHCHIEQWNLRYQELVNFQKQFHHCLVPLNWSQNPSLAHWVKRQRHQYKIKLEGKHSTMTDQRQRDLERLGFVWDSHAAAWEERWNELCHFKERFGHTNVPKKFPENPQLAVWVKCQRRQYKLYTKGQSSNMSASRIEKLRVLGFVFSPRMKTKTQFT